MYLRRFLAMFSLSIAVISCNEPPEVASESQQEVIAVDGLKVKQGEHSEPPAHSIMPYYKKTELHYNVEPMVTNGKIAIAQNTTTSRSPGRATIQRCTLNRSYKSPGRSLDISYKLIESMTIPVGPKDVTVGDGPPAIPTDIYLFEIKENERDWVAKTVFYRGETSLVVWDSDGAFFELRQPEESHKVIAVTGANTIKVHRQISESFSELVQVRLYGVDVSGNEQGHGTLAKKRLSELVLDTFVTLTVMNTDGYGRRVCKVYDGQGENRSYINLRMINAGLARHAKNAAPEAMDLAKAEDEAKKNRLGIWKAANFIQRNEPRESK